MKVVLLRLSNSFYSPFAHQINSNKTVELITVLAMRSSGQIAPKQRNKKARSKVNKAAVDRATTGIEEQANLG